MRRGQCCDDRVRIVLQDRQRGEEDLRRGAARARLDAPVYAGHRVDVLARACRRITRRHRDETHTWNHVRRPFERAPPARLAPVGHPPQAAADVVLPGAGRPSILIVRVEDNPPEVAHRGRSVFRAERANLRDHASYLDGV
jgi:hypothetical protein